MEDNASVDLATDMLIGGYGEGHLTVQSGATASAREVLLGVRTSASGDALVTGPGSLLSAGSSLDLGGDTDTTRGGVGTLTVDGGGAVQVADITKFWTSASSITVNGGTFETNRLTNHTGVVATVSISDIDANTPALTVGAADGSSTFDGLIQDVPDGDPGSLPGSLEKVGNGTFTLTGPNTYSGGTIVNGGSIIINHATALGDSTVWINVDDGLDVLTNSIDATIGALAGDGSLNLGSQELLTGGNGADTTYSGVIDGTNNSMLRHNGAGTLTLTGGDDATPSILGTLRAQSGAVVLDGTRIDLTSTDVSVLTGALLANSGDITIQNGADVRMATASAGLVENGALAITGIGSSLTGERLDAAVFSGNTGSILVEDSASLGLTGGLIIGWQGDGDLTVRSGATTSANNVTLGVEGAASGQALVTGNNSLLSSNGLNLGGRHEFSLGDIGTLTVDGGGAVQVTGETKFWTSTSSMTINGGTFETDQLSNHAGVAATVSISDPIGGTALTVGTGNGSSTFDGLIEGTGSLRKVGSGNFTLTGANTFSGMTHIDGGSIILDHATALAYSTVSINVNNGLDVTTHAIDATIGALAGSGNLNLGSQSLTAGGNDASTTYSGVLSGAGPLTKTGAGVLTLTGANTHAQGTTISGGALQIGNGGTTGSILGDVTNDASLIFNRSNDLTFDGVVSGTGSVTKDGSGTLTLTGGTTYSGGTTIEAGTVSISANGNLGTGDITFTGGLLSFDADFNFYNRTLIATSAGDARIETPNLVSFLDTAIIQGEGGFVKTGSHWMFLHSNNTYQGSTQILEGVLVLTGGAGERLPDSTDVLVNGRLDIRKDPGIAETIGSLSGSGLVRFSAGDSDRSLRVGANNSDSTFDGIINTMGDGNGSLTKIGTGTLALTGANAYFGGTTISGGALQIGNGGATGSITGDITNNGLLIFNRSDDLTFGGAIDGTGSLTQAGAGTLTLTGGDDATPSNVGTLRAQSGAVVLDGARIDLTSNTTAWESGALVAYGGDITIQNGADVQMTAAAPLGLVEYGVLTITGIGSSLTGHRLDTAQDGGSTGSILVEDSASLGLTGRLIIGVFGSGDLTVQTGASTSADEVNLGLFETPSSEATVTGPGSLLVSNSLNIGPKDSGGPTGTGTLTVEDGGAVQVAGQTKFWTPTSSMTINGGTFETDQLNSFFDRPTVSISDPIGGVALTVGTNDGSSSFDGLIQDAVGGAGSLAKVGSGTFTLTGANTYTEGTTINGGTLLAGNTTGSATGSGAVQVNSGGTLGGTGSVAGAVTVASGGTLAPGASTGTLSLGDNFAMELGATLAIELDGTLPGVEVDSLDVGGNVTLGGTLSLTALSPLQPDGHVWGDKSCPIITGGAVVDQFSDSPQLGDHLGHGVFLTDTGDNAQGITYNADSVVIDILQAAPGDTDGNRKVEGQDILNILQAGLFGDGVTPEANWGNGDFNSDSKISGEDILALLGTGLFGDGTYPDSAAAAGAADVKLVVTGGGLVIDAGDATITGFVLSSKSGILTGDDADNLGLFQEDTDAVISGTFAMSLKGEHGLGDVIGQTDVDLGGDLSLAYTIAGVPGIFTASVVVPEPGTLMLLLSGLIALLIRRRRK